MAAVDAALLEGTAYRLVRELGKGAMGEVYVGEQIRLRRPVVVKILKPTLGAGATDRLRLEAQALASVHHENVVEVLDCDRTVDNRPFIVMELLAGDPLDVYLARQGGALEVGEAVDVARQTLNGLHAVHQAGFVHRDIKPANLYRCSGGRIKLLDFGVIKLVDAVADIQPLAIPTRAGTVVGTPKYMAPEQAMGKSIDGRTDIYATAMVFYRMLSGHTAFDHHADLTELLYAQVGEEPRPPSELASQPIDPRLDAVVLRALAKDPDDRYPDALAFASALVEFTPGFAQLAVQLGLDQVDAEQASQPVVMHYGVSRTPPPVLAASPMPSAVGTPPAGTPRAAAAIDAAGALDSTVASSAFIPGGGTPTGAVGVSSAPSPAAGTPAPPAAAWQAGTAGTPWQGGPPSVVPGWRDPIAWVLFVVCAAVAAALVSGLWRAIA